MKKQISRQKVKLRRKFTLYFWLAFTFGIIQSTFTTQSEETSPEKIYKKNILVLQEKLLQFEKSCSQKASKHILKKRFADTRAAYKRLSVIIDYFNIAETQMLNSPSLERLASDDRDSTKAPEGLQAVEQLLYVDWIQPSYDRLRRYIQKMQLAAKQLSDEKDITYKFRPAFFWDAIRSSVLQLITLGITGFDSPIALQSIPEAAETLEGIKILLQYFQVPGVHKKEFTFLLNKITAAISYLRLHPDFNSFDRLYFITTHGDPIYKQICKVRDLTGAGIPEGSNPLNFQVNSIFGKNAFNINFFSPDVEFQLTSERAELGRRLFFDNILSGDKTKNCASCHNPAKAFTDGETTPLSTDGKARLKRNSPTLLNTAYQTKFFWDSRAALLEAQLMTVIHSAEEMKGSLEASVQELKRTAYADLFKKAYPEHSDPLTSFTIVNSISNYIRTLTPMNSRFDMYMRGDKTKMNETEKKGFNLFAGKGKCATCHFIPLFNGLVPPVFNETESEVLGVPDKAGVKNASLDDDFGRFLFTGAPLHKHAFKTPTVRNIALTAPYMHNGVYSSLDEVVDFYNKGGGKGLGIAPENQTLPFEKLNLSQKEKREIILFMKTLTDTTLINHR